LSIATRLAVAAFAASAAFPPAANAGRLTTVYTFQGKAGGANPYHGPLARRGRARYGTLGGGAGRYGDLVRIDLKAGQQSVLETFTGGSDGSNPVAPLLYHDGAFYGTTDGGYGTVFKFVP